MSFVPHTPEDRQAMLDSVGVSSVDDLFSVINPDLRYPELKLPPRLSEVEAASVLSRLAARNLSGANASFFLGAGSYYHYVPATVQQITFRGEFYTAYTPYQPEVAQGTLQVIYEFQTMVAAITGMDISNASMYDGATAMAEGAHLAVSLPKKRNKIVVSGSVHPSYRSVLQTYTRGVPVDIVELPVPTDTHLTAPDAFDEYLDDSTACVVIQYPNFFGRIEDVAAIAEKAHAAGARLLVSTYPIALGLLKSPGELGADIVSAEGEPLGCGQNFGGPVVGLLACNKELVRQMPGRLAGMTEDLEGKRGFVLALQTREQHIRREKATSNICTNQGLYALAATVYMASLGPGGLRQVAELCYHKAHYLAGRIHSLPGWEVVGSGRYFNEFAVKTPASVATINAHLAQQNIIGGFDLGSVDPALQNQMLVCATEMNDKASIDAFVQALSHFSA